MFINRLTQTQPIHIHANGNTSPNSASGQRVVQVLDDLQQATDYVPESPRLTVVTFSTYDTPTLVERELAKWGVTPVVLRQASQWRHTHKLRLILSWLPETDAEFILFTDATDVLFAQHPNRILDRLTEQQLPALISAERGNYPPDNPIGPQPGIYPYANAGGVVGHRDTLLELYTLASSIEPSRFNRFCDQHKLRIAADQLGIPLDTNATIFQTLAFLEEGDVAIRERDTTFATK